MCWIDIIERFKQLPLAEQEAITRALGERYAARVIPVEVVDEEYFQAIDAPRRSLGSQS